MAALKSITAPKPDLSTEKVARIEEFLSRAMSQTQELRKLFTIITRMVDGQPEGEQDDEMQYIADHGERLAAKLSDDLDGFSLKLTRAER